mgnify:FL=1
METVKYEGKEYKAVERDGRKELEPVEPEKTFQDVLDFLGKFNLKSPEHDDVNLFLQGGHHFPTEVIDAAALWAIGQYLNDGWEPDWDNDNDKWYFDLDPNIEDAIAAPVRSFRVTTTFFKDRETAEKAAKLFKDYKENHAK